MQQQNNITQRIGAQLAARMKEQAGTRADMYLADYVPVSASSAKIMIGFDGRFGAPNANHVLAFVNHRFNGELDTEINTVTAHVSSDARKHGVSVIVRPQCLKLPYEERTGMLAISSTMFMDQQIGNNWETKEGPDGRKYLECVRGENLPEILNTAIASQGPLHGAIRFNEHGVQSSVEVHVGDFVEFYTEQGGLRRGDVTKIDGDKISILAEDRQFVVDAPAVRMVLALNPKVEEQRKKEMEAFYALTKGPEFARKLVRGI
jgi:hypothetical protein